MQLVRKVIHAQDPSLTNIYKQDKVGKEELMHVCLTSTLKVGVSLSGPGMGHAPVLSVPANHSAVLAVAMVAQVCPHAEHVQLHLPKRGLPGSVSGTAAQPQGAVGGDGLSDDPPLCHHFPINLKHLRSSCC